MTITTFQVGDIVTSTTNEQGLVKGQRYKVRYVQTTPYPWGGGQTVSYFVTKAHASRTSTWYQVENGHVVFKMANAA